MVASGDRRGGSAALTQMYPATAAPTAQVALDDLEASELGENYPRSVKVWRDAWARFVPFLQFPPAARQTLTDWGYFRPSSLASKASRLARAVSSLAAV